MVSNKEVAAVSMVQVYKDFGRTQALQNVSLSIQPGEIVALLGPNGAGKTTAISLMLGLRTPSSGTVRLFGSDPRHPASRRQVACMLQESKVPETLKVNEAIEMFRRLYHSSKTVTEALAVSDLQQKAHARVGSLSGGERQRLYFALCFVADPALLFLDEPTVAMDVDSRRKFWEQIKHMASQGKTIVLTTHYLEEADALAERIIVVNQGQIVAEGTPRDIKGRVSSKMVRFSSSTLHEEHVAALSGIQKMSRNDHFFTIWTAHPESLLQQLFVMDMEIKDLQVTEVGLEEAFIELTSRKVEEATR